MLCDCDIENKWFVIVVYFKIAPQIENQVKVSEILRAGTSGCLAQPSRDQEEHGVDRCTGSDRKTVMNRDSSRMPFEAVPGRPCASM